MVDAIEHQKRVIGYSDLIHVIPLRQTSAEIKSIPAVPAQLDTALDSIPANIFEK